MIDRIPILRIRDVLIVSIQVDLHDTLVQRMQEDLLRELERAPARGLVVDISAVDVLDTFTARALAQTARMASVMGTAAVIVGMRPSIAQTLVEMGFMPFGFRTALDLDSALHMLQTRRNGVIHRRRRSTRF